MDSGGPQALTLEFENLHSSLASIQYSYGGFIPNEHRSRLQLIQSRIIAHITRTCDVGLLAEGMTRLMDTFVVKGTYGGVLPPNETNSSSILGIELVDDGSITFFLLDIIRLAMNAGLRDMTTALRSVEHRPGCLVTLISKVVSFLSPAQTPNVRGQCTQILAILSQLDSATVSNTLLKVVERAAASGESQSIDNCESHVAAMKLLTFSFGLAEEWMSRFAQCMFAMNGRPICGTACGTLQALLPTMMLSTRALPRTSLDDGTNAFWNNYARLYAGVERWAQRDSDQKEICMQLMVGMIVTAPTHVFSRFRTNMVWIILDGISQQEPATKVERIQCLRDYVVLSPLNLLLNDAPDASSRGEKTFDTEVKAIFQQLIKQWSGERVSQREEDLVIELLHRIAVVRPQVFIESIPALVKGHTTAVNSQSRCPEGRRAVLQVVANRLDHPQPGSDRDAWNFRLDKTHREVLINYGLLPGTEFIPSRLAYERGAVVPLLPREPLQSTPVRPASMSFRLASPPSPTIQPQVAVPPPAQPSQSQVHPSIIQQPSISQSSYIQQPSITQSSYIQQPSISQSSYIQQPSISQSSYIQQPSITQSSYIQSTPQHVVTSSAIKTPVSQPVEYRSTLPLQTTTIQASPSSRFMSYNDLVINPSPAQVVYQSPIISTTTPTIRTRNTTVATPAVVDRSSQINNFVQSFKDWTVAAQTEPQTILSQEPVILTRDPARDTYVISPMTNQSPPRKQTRILHSTLKPPLSEAFGSRLRLPEPPPVERSPTPTPSVSVASSTPYSTPPLPEGVDIEWVAPRLAACCITPAEENSVQNQTEISILLQYFSQGLAGHILWINLSPQNQVSAAQIQERVKDMLFNPLNPYIEHRPPTLQQTKVFCRQVKHWLQSDVDNIVIVNYPVVQGTAAMLCCCYMIHMELLKTVEDVENQWQQRRPDRGWMTCSQRRALVYYSTAYNKPILQNHTSLFAIRIMNIPSYSPTSVRVEMRSCEAGGIVFQGGLSLITDANGQYLEVNCGDQGIVVSEEVTVTFFADPQGPGQPSPTLFSFTVHCSFFNLATLTFSSDDLDFWVQPSDIGAVDTMVETYWRHGAAPVAPYTLLYPSDVSETFLVNVSQIGRREAYEQSDAIPMDQSLGVVLGGAVSMFSPATNASAFVDLHELFGTLSFMLNLPAMSTAAAHESDTRICKLHPDQIRNKDWGEYVWLHMHIAASLCQLYRYSVANPLPNRLTNSLSSVIRQISPKDRERLKKTFDLWGLPVNEALQSITECRFRIGMGKAKSGRFYLFRFMVGFEYTPSAFSTPRPPISMSLHSVTNIGVQQTTVIFTAIQDSLEISYGIECKSAQDTAEVFQLLNTAWINANGGQPGGVIAGGWERQWGSQDALPTLIRMLYGAENEAVQHSSFFTKGQHVPYRSRGTADLWVVMSGVAVVERNMQIVGRLEPGDMFGEAAFLEGLDEDDGLSNVISLTERVQVIALPAAAIRPLLEQQPAFASQLHCHMSAAIALRIYKLLL